jgi:hypothetical protein
MLFAALAVDLDKALFWHLITAQVLESRPVKLIRLICDRSQGANVCALRALTQGKHSIRAKSDRLAIVVAVIPPTAQVLVKILEVSPARLVAVDFSNRTAGISSKQAYISPYIKDCRIVTLYLPKPVTVVFHYLLDDIAILKHVYSSRQIG